MGGYLPVSLFTIAWPESLPQANHPNQHLFRRHCRKPKG